MVCTFSIQAKLPLADGDERGYKPSSHYLVHRCALSSTFLLDIYIGLTDLWMMYSANSSASLSVLGHSNKFLEVGYCSEFKQQCDW